MTTTADRSALARQRLEAVVDKILPPGAVKARAILLGAVSEYTAAMIELCARPDDRWEPERPQPVPETVLDHWTRGQA